LCTEAEEVEDETEDVGDYRSRLLEQYQLPTLHDYHDLEVRDVPDVVQRSR
jgi:hypothetical protein